MALNKWIGIGRITKPLELKQTQGGVSVCSFSIAADRPYNSSKEKETDFINIVAWRNSAEFVCRNFQKGDPIQIEGRIQTRTYQDQNGNNRAVVEIVADRVDFVEGYRRNEQKPNADIYEMPWEEVEVDEEFPFL